MRATKDGMKFCPKCQDTKPISEYGKSSNRVDGLYPWCLDCRRVKDKQNRKGPKGDAIREYHRDYLKKYRATGINLEYRLKKQYNITLEDYISLLQRQNFKCAICDYKPEDGEKSLCVDHNHQTGNVRALLCHNCNFVVGNCKEDPIILAATIKYLNTHKVISSQDSQE